MRWAELARVCLRAAVVAAALVAISPPALSQTLAEALAAAYQANPTLRADRERQKATDEQLPQAVSGFRPTVGAFATTGRERTLNTTTDKRTSENTTRVGVRVTQPLFNGMKTVNGVRRAMSEVRAGRQQLVNTEQNVLLEATTAYLGLLRDRQIDELNRDNVEALSRQLAATQARFRGGELTRTDVEQAAMRYARALAEQQRAAGDLAASRAAYRQVIGSQAGQLRPPPTIDALLPPSQEAALETARAEHPAIRSAAQSALAARQAVDIASGDFLPKVSLEGELYREFGEAGFSGEETDGASVQVRLDVPVYQAGAVTSRLRQARATRNQRDLELIASQQAVEESIAAAWAGLAAARLQIESRKNQVAAARAAQSGVEQQARAGLRTTLDVLDAQQELIDARISLVRARHDEALAGFSLLAAMGWLTADKLGLLAQPYDARRNLVRLRTGAFDFLHLR